jgi:hypothetical protein
MAFRSDLRRTRADLLAALDRWLWLRLVLLVIAGAALLEPVEWVVRAGSGTTETRAVIAYTDIERGDGYRGTDDNFEAVAVTADGQAIDLAAASAGEALAEQLAIGAPVIITRSVADGRVLQVRGPLTTVNVDNHLGMVIVRVLSIGFAAAGIWLGVRRGPRRWLVSALAVSLGMLLCYGVFPRQHDIGPYGGPIPDAMSRYADPPTAAPAERFGRQVAAVVPIGTRVESAGDATHVTVTGPPEPGLPPGADPRVGAGFATLRVPLLAEPGPDSGLYGPGRDFLPNMDFIGEGLGRVTALDEFPTCGGSPEAFPSRFAAPHRGYVCFIVPDGFVPRYLVFFNDDVAVDLRGTPNPTGEVVPR